MSNFAIDPMWPSLSREANQSPNPHFSLGQRNASGGQLLLRK
jgi:hypothetical protein